MPTLLWVDLIDKDLGEPEGCGADVDQSLQVQEGSGEAGALQALYFYHSRTEGIPRPVTQLQQGLKTLLFWRQRRLCNLL